jgi:hypothetical protein
MDASSNTRTVIRSGLHIKSVLIDSTADETRCRSFVSPVVRAGPASKRPPSALTIQAYVRRRIGQRI